MSEPWYKESFGPDYLRVYPHRGEDEAEQQLPLLLAELELTPGQRVLDLACGNGRHTRRLRSHSLEAFGMDLSDSLLKQAKLGHDGHGELPYVQGDMRFLPFTDQSFDAVVNLFTSFGYFESDEENRRVLEEIRRILRPKGGLLMDYLNPEIVIRDLVPRSESRRGDLHILQERTYDPVRSRVEKTITLTSEKPEETSIRTFRESVGLFPLRQMREFFEEAGMTVTRALGDFDGSDFSESSPRMILIGRRRS